jgi:hypothetical protein
LALWLCVRRLALPRLAVRRLLCFARVPLGPLFEPAPFEDTLLEDLLFVAALLGAVRLDAVGLGAVRLGAAPFDDPLLL